jgi:hypothetical protein
VKRPPRNYHLFFSPRPDSPHPQLKIVIPDACLPPNQRRACFLLYFKSNRFQVGFTAMDIFDILGALIALTALARLMLV